jgi:arylsulfatase/uncharacterized sulfatase
MRAALWWQGYVNDYETLGLKGSFNNIGPSFASAAASPLDFYKFYAGEGGMRVPLIIAGEPIPAAGRLTNALAYVTDITPTILDATGVSPPNGRFGGRPVEQIVGRSLLPLVRGEVERVYSATDTIGYELGGNAALFQGDYKIVLNIPPVGDNQWHLYNIVTDPGETDDLKDRMPERFEEMLAHYQQYVVDNNVLPLPANYDPVFQGIANGVLDRFGLQILVGLLTLVVLLPFLVWYRASRQ